MIYVVGDFHANEGGEIDHLLPQNFEEEKFLSKHDVVIQLGDFGLPWVGSEEEEVYLNFLAGKPYTFCFIDGNHENFPLLKKVSKECEIFGSKARSIETKSGKIYWLQRGHIYNIDGKKILTIGGADSYDKERRKEFINWWKDELLTYEEMVKTIKNIEENNWKVDYVLTHTCPSEIIDKMFNIFPFKTDPVTTFFDYLIEEGLQFKEWHFGHWHENKSFVFNGKKFFCHYHKKPSKIT